MKIYKQSSLLSMISAIPMTLLTILAAIFWFGRLAMAAPPICKSLGALNLNSEGEMATQYWTAVSPSGDIYFSSGDYWFGDSAQKAKFVKPDGSTLVELATFARSVSFRNELAVVALGKNQTTILGYDTKAEKVLFQFNTAQKISDLRWGGPALSGLAISPTQDLIAIEVFLNSENSVQLMTFSGTLISSFKKGNTELVDFLPSDRLLTHTRDTNIFTIWSISGTELESFTIPGYSDKFAEPSIANSAYLLTTDKRFFVLPMAKRNANGDLNYTVAAWDFANHRVLEVAGKIVSGIFSVNGYQTADFLTRPLSAENLIVLREDLSTGHRRFNIDIYDFSGTLKKTIATKIYSEFELFALTEGRTLIYRDQVGSGKKSPLENKFFSYDLESGVTSTMPPLFQFNPYGSNDISAFVSPDSMARVGVSGHYRTRFQCQF